MAERKIIFDDSAFDSSRYCRGEPSLGVFDHDCIIWMGIEKLQTFEIGIGMGFGSGVILFSQNKLHKTGDTVVAVDEFEIDSSGGGDDPHAVMLGEV